ncbi:uncharacterized protein LOC121238346 isoform X2 [Juglans microcarpa x Juglans regia]|uniref:uncharacterized protein LOC121238346 isoform X2 n=1 Tax=Juglans microcarpa x Juglans regia TaxID=2249226 RepID=UPI001B7E8FFE|nr:uncharacterized protein LOC121238346 isoform X2 [Juglans microcarpa x Juglans regia]
MKPVHDSTGDQHSTPGFTKRQCSGSLQIKDMATTIPPGTIVPEVLGNTNYENWSACIKNYLLAQDLWDIIETTTEPPKPEDDAVEFKAWRKRNAATLHAIQISCGMDILSKIKDISPARILWDTLAEMYEQSAEGIDPEVALINSSNTSDRKQNHEQPPNDANQDVGNSSSSPGRDGNQNNEFSEYAVLLRAIQSGNWNATNDFLKLHPNAKTATIENISGQTALHIAVAAEHEHIVEKLVEMMKEEDLAILDSGGNTALAYAAIKGNNRMVKCMVRKNNSLVSIGNNQQDIPVVIAFENGHKELARYLYLHTPLEELKPEKGHNGATLLNHTIYTGLFDIAVHLMEGWPRLAFAPDRDNFTPLYVLASMPQAFPGATRLVFWKKWIYSCIQIPRAHTTDEIRLNIQNNQEIAIGSVRALLRQLVSSLLNLLGFKQLYEMKLVHVRSYELVSCMCKAVSSLDHQDMINGGVYSAIFRAMREGILEIVVGIVTANPKLLHIRDAENRGIVMLAALHRHADIFLATFRSRQASMWAANRDIFGNNILHMVALLTEFTPLDHIPGAALQMQRELQWFKVESLCNPMITNFKNADGLTPRQLFTKTHKDLMKEGERWMKDTSTSCTVVGALIVTIMFAAAFTVPGGNNQETGLPIFLHNNMFKIFILTDSLSLFSSSASVLIFLGILTSRYAEEDFLKSLPKRMIIGLCTLFFSITTMMIAFSTALLIMLRGHSWTVNPVICLASIPVTLFVLMQFHLLVDMFAYTYRSSIFDNRVKPWFKFRSLYNLLFR